jgi:DNA mismatch repair protein MutL
LPTIKVLDEITANQIAAGEVVERPSSVVKELVENSLDAGATRIAVAIKGGGLQLIQVTDNGSGMDEADAGLAFQRHATSKIKSLSDIEKINSLGFRGEALPSIASVSRLEMVTRPPEHTGGTRLVIEGGRLLSLSPAGCPPGTTILVKDLFFNTPARLKYMKSKSTETGHITDIMSRLALARPDVAVKLEHEGRTTFSTQGSGNVVDALSAVYGAETARNMVQLAAREENMAIRGFIAPPSMSKSTRRNITVIINGRYVRNYLISTAVIDGFGTLIPHGRFPVALIYIDIAPEILDVNVHPSKMVVRVSGESNLFNLVRRTVTAALRTERVIPGLEAPGGGGDGNNEYPPVTAAGFKIFERSPVAANPAPHSHFQERRPSFPEIARESRPVVQGIWNANEPARRTEDLFDSIYPIGFLPSTYILAGSARGLVIIDQHAAHERVLYEKFLKALGGDLVDTQILLVPLAIDLSPNDYRAAEENTAYFASLGIIMEVLGPGSLLIREIPAGFSRHWAEEIVRDLLEYIIESGRKIKREDLVTRLAASAACRDAVKSGTRSSLEEAQAIIDRLKEAETPYTCPHGRPTMIVIGEQELNNRFKRT